MEPSTPKLARNNMKKLIVAALALGAAALNSDAALAYNPGLPWCIHYTRDIAPICNYPSYASCMMTASGNVGYCTPNPAFFSSNEQAWGQAFSNPYNLPPPPPATRRPRAH
jgi:hypothetical protein